MWFFSIAFFYLLTNILYYIWVPYVFWRFEEGYICSICVRVVCDNPNGPLVGGFLVYSHFLYIKQYFLDDKKLRPLPGWATTINVASNPRMGWYIFFLFFLMATPCTGVFIFLCNGYPFIGVFFIRLIYGYLPLQGEINFLFYIFFVFVLSCRND